MARRARFDDEDERRLFVRAVREYGTMNLAARSMETAERTIRRSVPKYPQWAADITQAIAEFDANGRPADGEVGPTKITSEAPLPPLPPEEAVARIMRRAPTARCYEDVLGIKQSGYWALNRREWLLFLQRLALDPEVPIERQDWALQRLDAILMGPLMLREMTRSQRQGEADALDVDASVLDVGTSESAPPQPLVFAAIPSNGSEAPGYASAEVIDLEVVDTTESGDGAS